MDQVGITVSQNATIDYVSTDEHGLSLGVVKPLIVFVTVIAVAFVIGVLIIRKRIQQPPVMSSTETGRIHSPYDNNANNVNVGHDEVNDDRHSSLNDETSNMIQGGTKMVDNPIYGSNRKQNSDFGRISDGSNSSTEMTGNVYESYKPKTLRMEENQEEDNYVIVSV
ncbi:hypothetical protein BSL78_10747 [Apostichopus japonicus]|uniref:Uncharacterized protein n=1 Tax=Stichopus japonicus TaxID=307972 RepID=A0A2G8KWG3_STIJA|nr:hypothetical protein BSL78_10747 [Apostichopus japonicus]